MAVWRAAALPRARLILCTAASATSRSAEPASPKCSNLPKRISCTGRHNQCMFPSLRQGLSLFWVCAAAKARQDALFGMSILWAPPLLPGIAHSRAMLHLPTPAQDVQPPAHPARICRYNFTIPHCPALLRHIAKRANPLPRKIPTAAPCGARPPRASHGMQTTAAVWFVDVYPTRAIQHANRFSIKVCTLPRCVGHAQYPLPMPCSNACKYGILNPLWDRYPVACEKCIPHAGLPVWNASGTTVRLSSYLPVYRFIIKARLCFTG